MSTILAQSFHFVGYVYNDLRKNSQRDINLGSVGGKYLAIPCRMAKKAVSSMMLFSEIRVVGIRGERKVTES